MDCDTTGVEPDFALVKFKKLAGGGYFKIVNQSVPAALKNLGYTQAQIDDIIALRAGLDELEGHAPRQPGLPGFQGADRRRDHEDRKDASGHVRAFKRFQSMGVERGDAQAPGRARRRVYEKPTFNFLRWAGLKETQLAEANEVICGTMTVEGAPHIKDEHLAVFDCANKCGNTGKRFIAPMGHVRMMAAAQPFLSGAISKTVNVPNETTVEEIQDIYYQGWKLGLKAVALYRDGCKLSQPLSTKSDNKTEDEVRSERRREAAALPLRPSDEPPRRFVASCPPNARASRKKRRSPVTKSICARASTKTGSSLGEVFIDMHKEGAAYRSMMNCFAIAVSLGLQYGVPLKEFVDKFTFTRFEPSGIVGGHPNVKMATSIVDYIFRVLGLEYLGRTDFVQVKPAVDLTTEKGAAGKVYPKEPSQDDRASGEVAADAVSLANAESSGHLARDDGRRTSLR